MIYLSEKQIFDDFSKNTTLIFTQFILFRKKKTYYIILKLFRFRKMLNFLNKCEYHWLTLNETYPTNIDKKQFALKYIKKCIKITLITVN
jgi:hypothetical protein